MKIIFDVKHLYYLPQYLPVYRELSSRQIACQFVFYQPDDKILTSIIQSIIEEESLPSSVLVDWEQALTFYEKEKAEWIIFGNAVSNIESIHKHSKTVLMQHGIGPKSCYYHVSNNQTTVRFVEGNHRLQRLQKSYPKGNFIDTGYAKLDPLFNNSQSSISIEELGLDPAKKTILYAPTFYPSSIECFSDDFAADTEGYNLIVKPHFFSLSKKKYAGHQRKLDKWRAQQNVYVAPIAFYNILPLMQISDALISDVSSVMFEFAAMDKPVIWCDFYRVKWSYRGIFKFRLNQRLDPDLKYFEEISERAKDYSQVLELTRRAINKPNEKSKQRISITNQLAGKTDGKCALRITDYLLNH